MCWGLNPGPYIGWTTALQLHYTSSSRKWCEAMVFKISWVAPENKHFALQASTHIFMHIKIQLISVCLAIVCYLRCTASLAPLPARTGTLFQRQCNGTAHPVALDLSPTQCSGAWIPSEGDEDWLSRQKEFLWLPFCLLPPETEHLNHSHFWMAPLSCVLSPSHCSMALVSQ